LVPCRSSAGAGTRVGIGDRAAAGRRGHPGGAVYDALIGLTAARHGAELVTRDVRAAATYEALAVPHRVIGG